MRASILSGLVAALSLSANALPTISTKGSYFFTSDGNRWFIKGVAYQLISTGGDVVDPFIDVGQCTRDATLMASIGVNAVRVYHVRPSLDHSACMAVFEGLGIYTFIDLDDYPSQLDASNPQWTNQQKAYFEAVMDEFAGYENTAGFFIGNEVINSGTQSGIGAYIRAAVRDMRAYRTSKGYRAIPIGYSHADIQAVGQNLEEYFACTSAAQDASSMLEFFSLNSYRWCGSNTFDGSGYSSILNQTANYPIPIFMSETGCNQPEPRLFQDQVALLGPEMNSVWSGAIIYEWLQEENHYGIVTYEGGNADANGFTPASGTWPRSGTPTPVQPDFNNLKSVWAGLNPTGVNINAYTPSHTPYVCPPYQAGAWQVDANQPLPSATGAITTSVSRAFNVVGAAAAVAATTTTPAAAPSVAPTSTVPVAAAATTTAAPVVVPVVASSAAPVVVPVVASSAVVVPVVASSAVVVPVVASSAAPVVVPAVTTSAVPVVVPATSTSVVTVAPVATTSAPVSTTIVTSVVPTTTVTSSVVAASSVSSAAMSSTSRSTSAVVTSVVTSVVSSAAAAATTSRSNGAAVRPTGIAAGFALALAGLAGVFV